MIYLWVDAGDGPTLVAHTQEEYDRLWDRVDEEAAELMSAPLEFDEDDE